MNQKDTKQSYDNEQEKVNLLYRIVDPKDKDQERVDLKDIEQERVDPKDKEQERVDLKDIE